MADHYDNAPTESWFATLKRELVYRTSYTTQAQARQDIFEYIEVWRPPLRYNRQRKHSAIGYKSPVAYEQQWKNQPLKLLNHLSTKMGEAHTKKKLTATAAADKEKIKQLEQRLKDSEQQLKHAKLKQEAYETMIGIAEKELNIKIRKKSGAGRPAPNRPTNEKQASFYRHRSTLRTVCSPLWTSLDKPIIKPTDDEKFSRQKTNLCSKSLRNYEKKCPRSAPESYSISP